MPPSVASTLTAHCDDDLLEIEEILRDEIEAALEDLSSEQYWRAIVTARRPRRVAASPQHAEAVVA